MDLVQIKLSKYQFQVYHHILQRFQQIHLHIPQRACPSTPFRGLLQAGCSCLLQALQERTSRVNITQHTNMDAISDSHYGPNCVLLSSDTKGPYMFFHDSVHFLHFITAEQKLFFNAPSRRPLTPMASASSYREAPCIFVNLM